jgi:hypothetical protein
LQAARNRSPPMSLPRLCLFILKPQDARCVRVLDLDPTPASSGNVSAITSLCRSNAHSIADLSCSRQVLYAVRLSRSCRIRGSLESFNKYQNRLKCLVIIRSKTSPMVLLRVKAFGRWPHACSAASCDRLADFRCTIFAFNGERRCFGAGASIAGLAPCKPLIQFPTSLSASEERLAA